MLEPEKYRLACRHGKYDRGKRGYEYVRRESAVRFLESKTQSRKRRIECRRKPRACAARYEVARKSVFLFGCAPDAVADQSAYADARSFRAERHSRKERKQTAYDERCCGFEPSDAQHAARSRFRERYAAAFCRGAQRLNDRRQQTAHYRKYKHARYYERHVIKLVYFGGE